MMVKGSPEIKILHIGIVEGVVDYGNLIICVVNWLVVKKIKPLKVKDILLVSTGHTNLDQA